MALEGLYVPTSVPWYPEVKSELLSFPAGKYDDQVDALGLIGQLLDQMVPGQKPEPPQKPKPDNGYRPLNIFARADDWATY
jgi:hypothetical protein